MRNYRKILYNIFLYFVLIFTVAISIFPIIWVLISAFKSNSAILSSPFSLPENINFDAFKYIFSKYDFTRYFINSLIVSLSSSLVALLIFAMAGYVLARFEFPFKGLIFILYTITLLVPVQAKAQPLFSLVMKLGLYDNIWGLSLVYLSMGLAMSIFILRSSFMSIPKSLDEAAIIEGANFFTIFWKINLPLAKSGLSTAFILMFLANWNEYFYASILTSSDKARTLPLALQFFTEAFSYNYTRLFAALTILILPGIIIYMLAQEQVQSSVACSGIK